MLWSELGYSGGAWPVVLEASSRLVVGKNCDPTIQQYWSCRIHAVMLPIWTAYLLVRRRVYAHSYCPFVKLADSSHGDGYDLVPSPAQIAHTWSWLTRPHAVGYDLAPAPIKIAYPGCWQTGGIRMHV